MNMYKEENKVLGVFGAIVGAALGIVIWCLIGKLGYISWVGGLAVSVFTLGGYLLLAKDVGKFGLLFSILLMIAAVYIATRLNWALSIQKALNEELGYDMSLGECFSGTMKWADMLKLTSRFYLDLGLGYLFTFAAGFSFIKKFAV